MSLQHDDDLPVHYLAELIVHPTREAAERCARAHGGDVIEGTDGYFVARVPVRDETVAQASVAKWDPAGTLVLDPRGELPPVWVPEE